MKLKRLIALLLAVLLLATVLCVPVAAANTQKKSTSIFDKIIKSVASLFKSSGLKTDKPIDFDYYKKKNPDIYAWITIPGTNVDLPILQSKEDDSIYLNHNWLGKKDANGALFTESAYNSDDFADPCTIIYGHRRNNGDMFGLLQEFYSDPDNFKKYDEIIIYLPEKELHYKIFAAVTYTNAHILYNYDFASIRQKSAFMDTVFEAKGRIGVNINEDNYNDKKNGIVILSTCMKGNNKLRYLVCAQLQKEVKVEQDGKTK